MEWKRARWRNYSIRTKTRIAVLLPMAALLLSSALVALVSSQHGDANRWVSHTLQVRLALSRFEHQFSTAEINAFGLQRSGQGSFDGAQQTLSQIQELTSDNPNQQRRIEQLHELLDKYRSIGGSSVHMPAISGPQTRVSEDGIEELVAEMDQEEARLLGSRTDRSGKLRRTLSVAIGVTLLLGILGALLATRLLSSNVSKRIAQLVESSVLMREGLAVKTLDPSQDELGQLAATLAQTSRVLTERAAQIAETNWKLESILKAATSASIIAEDSSGRITLFSTGASLLLGYRAEEVMGRDFSELVQSGSASIPSAPSSAAATGKQQEPSEYDTVYVRKDQVPLHVHASTTTLKNLSGKVVGRLHVAQDITPRKLLEEELRNKIDVRTQENQTLSKADSEDIASLPHWLKAEGSNGAERLSWNLDALNDWYETKGEIANPHEQNFWKAARILVVDDFAPTRFLLRVYLQQEGYHLDFAADGAQALEQVAQQSYDLILMDVEMPQMNGYEAASRIRDWEKSQGRAPVPIVALSAQAQNELDTTVWTSYIQKPVSKGQLLEAVREYVEAKVA